MELKRLRNRLLTHESRMEGKRFRCEECATVPEKCDAKDKPKRKILEFHLYIWGSKCKGAIQTFSTKDTHFFIYLFIPIILIINHLEVPGQSTITTQCYSAFHQPMAAVAHNTWNPKTSHLWASFYVKYINYKMVFHFFPTDILPSSLQSDTKIYIPEFAVVDITSMHCIIS